MILGFFDLECTSVEPRSAFIIEWALLRYCTDSKKIVSVDTELVKLPERLEISKEIEDLTGITNALLESHGRHRVESFMKLQDCLRKTDMIVAHNGVAYDFQVLSCEFAGAGFEEVKLPVIDTMFDVPYPESMKTRKLSYLAAEHGFINPLAHRALSDCITLWKIFTQYDFESIRAIAATPIVEVRADVKFSEKDLAKKAAYRWDAARKIWCKTMRRYFLQAERAAVKFQVLEL